MAACGGKDRYNTTQSAAFKTNTLKHLAAMTDVFQPVLGQPYVAVVTF